MLYPDARVEETKVLGDLGDRRYGGLATSPCYPLLERDRGGDPGERVDVGPRKLLDVLTRPRRHRLHEAALPLGKNNVEGERGLSRATDSGDDGPFAVGDIN